MSKHFLLIVFLSLICIHSLCQETEDHIKRNVIKGSIASSGIVNGMISLDYERNLVYAKNIKINFEGTYGKYFQIHIGEAVQAYPTFRSITSSINSLVGREFNFVEVSVGIRYSIIKVDYYDDINPFFPVLNVGYRYQNYKGRLVFRAFVGSTGMGLSVGIAF